MNLLNMEIISMLSFFQLLAMSKGSPVPTNFGVGSGGNEMTHTQLPEIELQLENLKVKVGETNQAPAPVKNQTTLSKSELNLEKPTVSDNSAPESFWDRNDNLAKRGLEPFDTTGYSYTPHDIAEYIYWTGDEQGVTMALGDLLENDVVSKEDALEFLELVKIQLQELKNRYDHHGGDHSEDDVNSKKPPFSPSDIHNINKNLKSFPKFNVIAKLGNEKNTVGGGTFVDTKHKNTEDYEEMMEKVKENEKNKMLSLKEEISRFAHEVFSKGSTEDPQLALQRLAHFVQNLAENWKSNNRP